jgi:hypothetical protein
MKRRIGLFGVFAALSFMAVMVPAASAVDTEATRETLKGLPGVYVVLEQMQPNIDRYAKKYGLTKDQLQGDVERRLKENGIRALSREEWMKTPGKPVLYLSVNTHETERYWYAYDIRIELQQVVYMVANPNAQTLATTWSISMTGMTNVGKLQIIRSDVGVLAGRFIGAFRASNP